MKCRSIRSSFLQTFWLGFTFVKREKCPLLGPPPPTPLSASFGHGDSWQAPLIFFINGSRRHQSVVRGKWTLVSIFLMTSHTQCMWSRRRLPRHSRGGGISISLHYHFRSTSWIGGDQNQPVLIARMPVSIRPLQGVLWAKVHDRIQYFHQLHDLTGE